MARLSCGRRGRGGGTPPHPEETQRLLADKAYLESLYRQGAEKAAAMANRTLRKVHKKVGFVPR